jgi:hypothetical protein
MKQWQRPRQRLIVLQGALYLSNLFSATTRLFGHHPQGREKAEEGEDGAQVHVEENDVCYLELLLLPVFNST